MKTQNYTIVSFLLISIFLTGCKKEFLEKKPSTGIVAPSSLADLQALLENSDIVNSSTPALPIMSGDEYIFLNYAGWQSTQTATERNAYIWARDLFEGATNVRDWNFGYSTIFYCNNVLEVIKNIPVTNENLRQYNSIKGKALFIRAYALYDLVTNFSPAFDANTSSADLGVPIRLIAGIDEVKQRSSVSDTYNQILSDLNEAKVLLDNAVTVNSNSPSRSAAFALFSRIYLSMRNYNLAEKYADSTLAINNKLINYNTINASAAYPFPINNVETIFCTTSVNSAYPIIIPASFNTLITVNPELLNLYDAKDLRLNIFFRRNTTTNNLYFNSGYFPSPRPFTGLATDEIYLIKSECLARRNQLNQAVATLNSLRINRFPPNNYIPLEVPEGSSDQINVLNMVLLERRRELVWRALRWSDIKRLNKEGANIILTRNLNGVTYTLLPNDPRYVFPIPDDEIALSGVQQNLR